MKPCYWCGIDGAFETHVPPTCMFPEKDEFEIDFKTHIESIPSCEQHIINEEKDFGYFTEVIRSVKWNNVFSDFKTEFKDKTYDFSIRNCNIDFKELEKPLSIMARGLYYSKFKRHFQGKIPIVFIGFLESEYYKMTLLRMGFAELSDEYPKSGKFQQLFFTQWVPAKKIFSKSTLGDHYNSDGILLRISFYEGAEFYLVFEDN